MSYSISEVWSGTGSAIPGWENAGFTVAWISETDGVARRIQKKNGRKCYSNIPTTRNLVDFIVFRVDSSSIKMKKAIEMIKEDLPPAFLIETEKEISPASLPLDYHLIALNLNASFYFSAHAKIRNYILGFLAKRVPDEELLFALNEKIKQTRRTETISVNDVVDDIDHFILTPFNRHSRSVHSSTRPCPEVHSRSGHAFNKKMHHPSDSVPIEESKVLGLDIIATICGIPELERPKAMERSSWFKWVGKSMDANLANLIGCEVLNVLKQGYFKKKKRICINFGIERKNVFRTSKISFIIGELEDFASVCETMGISYSTEPNVTIEYLTGTNAETDRKFNEACKIQIPCDCKVKIKTRSCQLNRLEDITWFYKNKLFRSRKELLKSVDR